MKDNKKHWKAAKDYGVYPESKEPEKECRKIARRIAEGLADAGNIQNEVVEGFDVIKPLRNKFIEYATAYITQALERERENAKLKLPNATKDIARRLAKNKRLADNVSNECEKLIVMHKLTEATELIERLRDSVKRFKDKFEACSRYQYQHLSKGLSEAEQSWAEVSDGGMIDFSDLFEALNQANKFLGEKS